MGPDQWLKRAPIFKEYERIVLLTDTQFSAWNLHKQQYYAICNDNVGVVTGSKNLTQFHGSSVLHGS